MCLVPSKPADLAYAYSTKSTMALSWHQSGIIDKYIVAYNDTVTNNSAITVTGTGNTSMYWMTVTDLPVPGAYYCISVTAVSGELYSQPAVLCNYTGT